MQLMGFVEGCLFLSMIGLDGWIGFPIWVGNFGTFSFIIFTRSSIIVLMGFIKKGVAGSLWLHTDLALQAGFIIGLSGISYSLVFTKRALFFPLFFCRYFSIVFFRRVGLDFLRGFFLPLSAITVLLWCMLVHIVFFFIRTYPILYHCCILCTYIIPRMDVC